MIAALVLACLPDLASFTATPELQWDRVDYCDRSASDPLWAIDCSLGAYYIYAAAPGQAFALAEVVPCYWYIPDLDDGPYRQCPDYFVPQKWTDVELEQIDFCVRAVDSIGRESIGCSNTVQVCMPELWRVGLEDYPNGE